MAGALIIPAGDDSPKDYPGKLTWYVVVTCIVAAMGGLIFGYDIGISGGVTSMGPFLEKFFPSVYRKEELDQSTNQYCKFNSQTLTMFTSSLYLAALFASFLAFPCLWAVASSVAVLFSMPLLYTSLCSSSVEFC
ncbi:hypothetical protein CsSME_00019147 [Camellia sinensis var. sinensis]